MYKSNWDRRTSGNQKLLTDEEKERILYKRKLFEPYSDEYLIMTLPRCRFLSSFEDSAVPLKYYTMFPNYIRKEGEIMTKRFNHFLSQEPEIKYAPVPPLDEPAIKIPRKFHEEYLEYRKKYLETN